MKTDQISSREQRMVFYKDRFKCFVVLLFFLLPISLKGQSVAVKGTVKDEKGLAVVGASIVVQGKTGGTKSDQDGSFALEVAAGEVLVASAIGYTKQELVVEAGKSIYDFTLSEESESLEEVVVTALGITRQSKSLVYATQTIKPSELTGVRDANNVINSLQGKVANAVITQGSGGPGSGARIVLRGNRSIQGTNNALIVVDGVPVANPTYDTPGSTFGGIQGPDGASNVNPDDIESTTVLRGASAAALYGSQAGNGVLVITTKKGKVDQYRVDINSGAVFENAFALPHVQNRYGQGLGGSLDGNVGDSWGEEMNGQSYTNYLGENANYSAQESNIRDFFRTGTSFNNYVGISGGNEKTQSYFSYTNNSVQGIVPQNKLGRHVINLRINNQLTDRLSSDAKVTYIKQGIDNLPRTGEENSPIMNIYQIPRNISIANARHYQAESESGLMMPSPWPSTLSSIYQNPYWMVHNTSINADRDRIMGFISLKYQLTDWLNVTGRANLDRIVDNLQQSYAEGTLLYTNSGAGGDFINNDIYTTQQWYDLIFSGDNQINENWRVNYNVGAIYRDISNVQRNVQANGLRVPNMFSIAYAASPNTTNIVGGNQTQSVFGQATVSYKDAIFFDGSYRNDWDSRLPSPYSFGYYSAGASVVLSDLLTLPSYLSFLKTSLNYAEVGNGGQEQIRLATFNFFQSAGNGQIGRNPLYPIADLKPEIVKNIEASIETRFLNDRIGFAATYYKSNSTNQLLSLSVPAATGYTTRYINAGNIQNHGFEFVIDGTLIRNDHFSWDVAFNLAMNRNRVIELSDDISFFYINSDARVASVALEEGGRYGDLYALKWATDAEGRYLVNANGLPISTAEPDVIGNFNPDANMGLSNTFNYKNFSLRALVDGRIGGTVVSGTEMNLAFSGIPEVTDQFREGGLHLGGVDNNGNTVDATVNAQDFWQTVSGKRYGSGEFFAYDATSFRLRELAIGYEIPLKETAFFNNMRVSLVGRNLFWIYRGSSKLDIPGIGKRKMWFDPDMSLANSNYQGVEYGTLPSTRSWGLNVQLSF